MSSDSNWSSSATGRHRLRLAITTVTVMKTFINLRRTTRLQTPILIVGLKSGRCTATLRRRRTTSTTTAGLVRQSVRRRASTCLPLFAMTLS